MTPPDDDEDDPNIAIAYDVARCKVGCVLIEAALGGTVPSALFFKHFGTGDSWTGSAPAVRCTRSGGVSCRCSRRSARTAERQEHCALRTLHRPEGSVVNWSRTRSGAPRLVEYARLSLVQASVIGMVVRTETPFNAPCSSPAWSSVFVSTSCAPRTRNREPRHL